MTIRVLVADDHRIVLDGLVSLISEQSDMTVVGKATDGRSAVNLATETDPDVIVMDLTMPELNGIEATRIITNNAPVIRIIALSMHSEKRFIRAALEGGASGYLVKENAFEELVNAIRAVNKGQNYLCPVATKTMILDYLHHTTVERDGTDRDILTPREREVLQMIAEGRRTKEIAGTLHISVKTVETHRKNIMEKLDVKSVAELTR
ncbi:MAG: response regulator transcription factor, partial [bacterium]